MADYVTIRRWALKPDGDEANTPLLRERWHRPAWREIPGCLSLNFLSVREDRRTSQ